MNEITCTFDHLLTRLTLVGLKVKVSKCKFCSPLMIYPGIEILQGCTLVTDGLRILGVLVGSQDFATHFLNEVLCQDLVHINNFPLLGDTHVALGILSSYVAHRPSYFTWIVPPSFMFLLAGFDKKIMQVCGDIMDPGSWEFFQGPLVRHQVQLPIPFGGMGLLSMEDYASFAFLGSCILVASYLCFKFHISDKLILEEYDFQVEGGPTLVSIMFTCNARWPSSYSQGDAPFFESLAVIAPSL